MHNLSYGKVQLRPWRQNDANDVDALIAIAQCPHVQKWLTDWIGVEEWAAPWIEGQN